jgi:GNAT superfamily N-acetyltransferase
MPADPIIRQATPADAGVVADILGEAAGWLRREGMAMWRDDELEAGVIAADVEAGLFFLAEQSGDPAGVVKFQLDDPLFWPDLPRQDAAYVHRLAVRRRYAGTGLSTGLLRWAVGRTGAVGRRCLRLDCEATRPRLRALYESFGFRYHSDRQAGPYFVSRFEYDVAGGRPQPPGGDCL